ncbi:MAG: carbamoyltransferase HypF [Chloroflexi bacterium]|nr:carbamoyltransferase HypF [Chloroflexota bacterium]
MTDTLLSPASCSLPPADARLRVEIHGAVQGVGFRPFVYRLATELGLTGWVINDTQGVFVEVEGQERVLAQFLERLPAEKPPLAIIQTLDSAWLPPTGFERFEIRHSDATGAKTVLVLPDVAICPACLAEILDPANRRYRYPFTNCTNCGPRFSIIEALPYDRPNTTMRRFTLCPACRAEYERPADRRFHAQPNACPVCGPELEIRDWRLEVQSAIYNPQSAICNAASALRAGLIVAVKGLGGFHLMVDATNAAAVARLRERKHRGDKPFAIMARDLEQVRQWCEISPEAEALLTSPPAPIVLLRRQTAICNLPSAISNLQSAICNQVAPGNPYLGVMLPYTPLHHLLLAEVGFPVVATSGNLTDEPICTDNEEAFERLGGIADVFLVHDRPIARHVDDSVAWIAAGAPRLLRRARGYAPLPVLLPQRVPTILAVGAHLKNTVALSVGRQAFISQHIGDLETPEAMAAFERVIADFLRLYEATPVAIAHDLHPDYLSTRWARQTNDERRTTNDGASAIVLRPSSLVAVQHHHAHLAACLAENGVEGPALGVTWDGTGYGTDGTIWGGEFLLGDAAGFDRVAHLRPFRLPGGAAAVHEPRRVALALLWEIYGEATLERDDLAPIRAFTPAERRTLAQMLGHGVNAPITTSAGRLFDGVAALIGLQQRVDFEGQAAMSLEFVTDETEQGAYSVILSARTDEKQKTQNESTASFVPGPSSFVLDWQPLLDALLADLRRGVPQGIMAARFHNALVAAIVAVAQAVGQPRVALTGGCFQNRLLVERTAKRLAQTGFEVLLHRQVPPNDGGISLGQIAVAAARLSKL